MFSNIESMSNSEIIAYLLHERDILMNDYKYGPFAVLIPLEFRRRFAYDLYYDSPQLSDSTIEDRIRYIEGVEEVNYYPNLQELLIVPLNDVAKRLAISRATVHPCECLNDL